MKLSFVEIRTELKPYIQAFWVFESSIGMLASEANLAAPNGCPKLIIPCENTITSFADDRVQQSYEEQLHFVGNRQSATLLHTSYVAIITTVISSDAGYPDVNLSTSF